MASLEAQVAELSKKVDRLVEALDGNGSVVLHNSRLEVDASVKITDLLKKLRDYQERIAYIESVVGSRLNPTPTVALPAILIGHWAFIASDDGDTLYKKVDLNRGATTLPSWCTKSEDSINEDDVPD